MDIIDLGGESTRPGSGGVSAQEEIDRVEPVIRALSREGGPPISIDTKKAAVARAALEAGAVIINDISGGSADPEMLPLAARTKCGLVLMHMRGRPGGHADPDRLRGPDPGGEGRVGGAPPGRFGGSESDRKP